MTAYNVKIESIDMNDYPDFCDAYIVYAEHEDGSEFTPEELEHLNEDADFVQNAVHNYLH